MADKKDEKVEKVTTEKKFEDLTENLAALNQNSGLQVIHADKIADLTAERNRMAARASGLSEQEAGRRADVDADMLKLQKQIEEDTSIAGEDAPKVIANQKILDKMKEEEEKKRAKLNFDILEKIGSGLGDLAENIGGKLKAGGGLLLKGIGVFALLAFMQSDTFKAGVKSLVDFVTEFIGIFTGETELGMNAATLGLAAAVGFGIKFLLKMGSGIKNSMMAMGTNYDNIFGKKGTLKKHAGKLKSMAKSAYTKVVDALGVAFKFLFGKAGFLRATIIPKLKLMGAGLLLQGKAMMISMGMALKGLLVSFGAILAPLLPFVAIGAAIAAIAYAVVRIFQGFQESFSEANEQFGFFGGILAGFTQGIKNILLDVVNVIDSVLGFFGFPDLMDPILKAIEEFDVMNFVGGVMDFFDEIGAFITEGLASIGLLFKAIGAGALAALTSPFSAGKSFNKAFEEVMSSGTAAKPADLGNIAAAGAGGGGENDPARFVARKEKRGLSPGEDKISSGDMMGGNGTVNITNNNVVNKGGDSYSENKGGDINVHDTGMNPYYNPA